jgi:hypothetical protein
MAQLNTKIKLYAKANGVNSIDFLLDVKLQDDSNGQGAYIKEWNLDIPQPTSEQLATYEDEANAEEALNTVYSNRLTEYPPIGDQLDMLWHSIDENAELKQKYFAFYEAIKAVKAKYPK